MRLRPCIARVTSCFAILAATVGLSACATDGMYMGGGLGRHAELVRPANQSVEWTSRDRLYRSVALERADGGRNRDALEGALERANLRAPAPAAARYAIQVIHGKGRAPDSYRLIERASGRPVFEQSGGRGGRADITQFIVALGAAEHVTMVAVVPCGDNAEVKAMKGALTARGAAWRSDDCQSYNQSRSDGGLRYTNYR